MKSAKSCGVSMQYDAIVVGAGLSGAVMAEQMATRLNWRVLVLDQRPHLAGNCFDERDQFGCLIHKYGPHLFHTNKKLVWDYLSRFTTWQPYEHKVLAKIGDLQIPLPFNLNSLYRLYQPEQAKLLEQQLVERYGAGARVPILELRQSGVAALQQLADWIYDNIFVQYTMRQWGISAEQIDPAVLSRVPVVLSRDDRYFHDSYQAMPVGGYSQMIGAMLAHPNIDTKTGVDALTRLMLADGKVSFDGEIFPGTVIYTGMLDQLFAYQCGDLPYRSLQFVFQSYEYPYYQTATTVNYPLAPDLTRITEFKHILGDTGAGTTIVLEYPQDYDKNNPAKNIPYYPVFTSENQQRYQQYQALAAEYPQLVVLGRLAEYKYFNMDDAVANALALFSAKFLTK